MSVHAGGVCRENEDGDAQHSRGSADAYATRRVTPSPRVHAHGGNHEYGGVHG